MSRSMATRKAATVLWTYIVKSLQTAFEQKEAANTALFDMVDTTKEDFDGCLTAIVSAMTTLLELSTTYMVAKKQLLASLDTAFYQRQAASSKLPRSCLRSTVGVAYSGLLPSGMDVQKLVKDFQFHIDAANEVLSSLKDDVDDDKSPTRRPAPPSGKPTGKPRGDSASTALPPRPSPRVEIGRKSMADETTTASTSGCTPSPSTPSPRPSFLSRVRCPPGYWHDTANCPTADIECEPCVIEQADDADGLVSAFQVAFDSEDAASFARLCARHDHPLVRQDEDPFTFAENIDVDVGHSTHACNPPNPPCLLRRHVHEAQHALRELKQVAGGAGGAPQHFPMVHFGSPTSAVIEKPAVEHEPTVTIESDDDSSIYPQQFIDNEPPFEQSFMDNMSVQLGFNGPEQQVSANSFTSLLSLSLSVDFCHA
ncbi:hypothetical protein CYMTET_32757 [Cymbomonas tetramitiformis]|uniref:Uncharacterized protein n=1 Tax=Cymbomonas tetramitiformis TaxID=36881 RepID=A0AAE0FEE4_9CHLO|nr:hypothetical protein CYMTET_32757 [Cymbomonas tetramitiformis]